MISTNIAMCVQVPGFSGSSTDAWQLGDWEGSWSAITSRIPIETGWLEPGEEYRFCFWLNGGENSTQTEVCTLEIYGEDWENRLCFRLNRNHTRPLLEKNHWLLYAVPFTAPAAASALTFRFVAANAVSTIAGIPDMNMASCEALTPDDPDRSHAQRHNLVYPHGWPEEDPEVVLSANGKEVKFTKKQAVRTAGIVLGAAAGIFMLCRGIRRKRRK